MLHYVLYRVIKWCAITIKLSSSHCIVCVAFPAAVKSKETALANEKLTKIRDIEIQFAKMTNRIKQALINNNVDIVSLIEQLCTISAVKNKEVPLFDPDVFEKIKSIDDFWKILKNFLRIFDYELLLYVVEISECKDAQQIFEEFLSKIDPSAITDMDLVPYCKVEHPEGSLKPVLRIKVKIKICTSDVKKQVEEIVSQAYDLEKYALCFQGIREGCIELLYYISQPLKTYVLQFKLSKNTLENFHAHKIISLHIDKLELDTTVSHKQCTVIIFKPCNKCSCRFSHRAAACDIICL